MKVAAIIGTIVLLLVGLWFLASPFMGAGAFKRMTTIGGVYSVCRPDNYPVVCFLDSDSDAGGLFCMPTAVVGECKK